MLAGVFSEQLSVLLRWRDVLWFGHVAVAEQDAILLAENRWSILADIGVGIANLGPAGLITLKPG